MRGGWEEYESGKERETEGKGRRRERTIMVD